MKIIKSVGTEKKDIVRAGVSVATFKDYIGEPVKMVGAVIFEKTEPDEKTGEMVTNTVTAIKLGDGTFISTISPTINNSLETILAVYTEDEITHGIEVVVKTKLSNAGREFLYLDLV